MPDDSTPIPPLNLDDDPEIQSIVNELEQGIAQQQAELETESQKLDAQIATAGKESKAAEGPKPDPAQLSEWEQMERTYGVAPEQSETAYHGAELSHQITHAVENVA